MWKSRDGPLPPLLQVVPYRWYHTTYLVVLELRFGDLTLPLNFMFAGLSYALQSLE